MFGLCSEGPDFRPQQPQAHLHQTMIEMGKDDIVASHTQGRIKNDGTHDFSMRMSQSFSALRVVGTVTMASSNTVPSGNVISETPSAGTLVNSGSAVNLTVSTGSATLVSIAVTPTSPSIAKGLTQQFTATGTYSDNSTQNLTNSVTCPGKSLPAGAIEDSVLGRIREARRGICDLREWEQLDRKRQVEALQSSIGRIGYNGVTRQITVRFHPHQTTAAGEESQA